jgi:hypothetical protein
LRKRIRVVVLLSLIALACAVAGCGSAQQPASSDTSPTAVEATGPQAQPTVAKKITMNGRSVMYNWMSHWGFSGEGAVKRNGYTIAYKELDANDIAPSFANNVSGLAPSSVTFFKFCFADFDGSNLATRQKEVEQVIATAKGRQLKLIIGNALPVRKEDGSPEMVQEYRKYNAFLDRQAASNQDVWVYDFYGVLAGPDGFLKPEYQTEDSHPNEKAYAVLDQSLFPLLDKVFAGQGQSSSPNRAHSAYP